MILLLRYTDHENKDEMTYLLLNTQTGLLSDKYLDLDDVNDILNSEIPIRGSYRRWADSETVRKWLAPRINTGEFDVYVDNKFTKLDEHTLKRMSEDRTDFTNTYSAQATTNSDNPAKQIKGKSMNTSTISKLVSSHVFRRVDNVVWDFMSGSIGFTTESGIVSLDMSDDDPQVVYNVFNTNMALPAFAMATQPEDIVIGDAIISLNEDRLLGFVVSKSGKKLRIMKPNGTSSEYTPPKTKFLTLNSGAMVVKNMMTLGGPNMQSLMPMLMMADSNKRDSMLPMMLLSGVASSNPTLLMALANEDKNISNLLPMLMTQNQSSNQAAINPMMLMMLAQEGGVDSSMLPMLYLLQTTQSQTPPNYVAERNPIKEEINDIKANLLELTRLISLLTDNKKPLTVYRRR